MIISELLLIILTVVFSAICLIMVTVCTLKKVRILFWGFFSLFFIIMISFCINNVYAARYEECINYETYTITKLVANSCYIETDNGNLRLPFSENYVLLEEPKEEYDNVVEKEYKTWKTNWLGFIKVLHEDYYYHVYLTEDMYDRVNDGDVYFDLEEGNLP